MILSPLERRVLSAAEADRLAHEAFLRDLVCLQSVTGQEGPAQRVIRKKFEEMGMAVEEVIPDLERLRGHPEYLPPFETYGSYEDRPNVIGRLRGTGGGRSLLMFGHIDTVPPGPREDWSHDPFGGEVVDGRMYGRGVQDMKGGLAAAILAVDLLARLGVKLQGDVTLMSNIEEEIGGSGGILACIERGYRADACIYPHPARGKPAIVQIASSGVLAFRVRVRGRSVHGYMAHVGINAIEKAMQLVSHLRDLDARRGVQVRDELAEAYFRANGLPARATTLCISKIRGGDWLYQVPGRCEVDCVLTYPHSEAEADVRAAVAQTIRAAAEADPYLKDDPPELEWLPFRFSSSAIALDEPILQVVTQVTEEILGRPPVLTSNPVGSDTRVTVLYGKTPTVNLGPGGANSHSPNEWLDMASFHQVIQVLALSVMRWCGVEGGQSCAKRK